MKKKQLNNMKFRERLNRVLDLSPDLLLGGMTVELIGGRQAIIEGMKNILEYDDNIVRVNDNKMEIRVLGADLSLRCMTEENIMIEGIISSVEYIH